MEKPSGSPAWRLAVETGTAFTSGCAYLEDTGEVFTLRVPSDAGVPSSSVLRVLHGISRIRGLNTEKLTLIECASTLAAGAVAAEAAPVTALLVTRGFRDLLLMKSIPLVPRRLTFEVTERTLPNGRVVMPLDEDDIIRLIPRLKKLGVQAVAVCFLHSCRNPGHEERAGEILSDRLPEVPVTISSGLTPAGEYKRAVAAVINAATGPLVAGHMDISISSVTGDNGQTPPFFFLQSDASLATGGRAARESARTVLSGPAAGVLSCLNLSRATGRPNLITFDMGAGGSRVSLIYREQPLSAARGWIGGYPLDLPTLEIATGGPGGFSIARVRPGELLRVGPEKTGASPGPPCFGRGGKLPTCTDANLLLGRVGAHLLHAGEIRPDPGAAREAMDQYIAGPLGITAEQAALEIVREVNSQISREIKAISVDKGYDPGEFALVAFGGAGPQHAAELAAILGIPRVIVPRHPGSYPAMGLFFADVRREFKFFLNAGIESVSSDEVNKAYHHLERIAGEELLDGGVPPSGMVLQRMASLRLEGQGYEMDMQVPAGRLKQADLQLLNRAYKLAYKADLGLLLPEDGETVIVSLKIIAMGKISPEVKHVRAGAASAASALNRPPAEGSRKVIFNGGPLETPVFKWGSLGPSAHFEGPALVEGEEATVLVWPEMSASADLHGNIIIEVGND